MKYTVRKEIEEKIVIFSYENRSYHTVLHSACMLITNFVSFPEKEWASLVVFFIFLNALSLWKRSNLQIYTNKGILFQNFHCWKSAQWLEFYKNLSSAIGARGNHSVETKSMNTTFFLEVEWLLFVRRIDHR